MREARRDAEAEDFQALETLRNALAHGSVPEWRRIRELLQSPERLEGGASADPVPPAPLTELSLTVRQTNNRLLEPGNEKSCHRE